MLQEHSTSQTVTGHQRGGRLHVQRPKATAHGVCLLLCAIAVAITRVALAAETQEEVSLLRETVAREVEFMAKVGNLTAEQTESLRREAEGYIRSRIGPASNTTRLVRINGRVVPANEATGELVRNDLSPPLKAKSRSVRDKINAERKRLDERRRWAAIASQIAFLDETLLLTTEQRTRLGERLAMRQSDAWWRPTAVDSPHVPRAERMHALIAGDQLGAFVIPEDVMSPLMRPVQRSALDELRPTPEQVLLIRESDPEAARRAQKPLIRALGPAPPFSEQRRRLTTYLERLIDEADALGSLTESDRARCLFAGRLDIERWQEPFATLEEVREGQVATVQSVFTVGRSRLPTSIFHETNSSFQKAIWGRLRGEARRALAEAARVREAFRRDALVATVVAGLEWNASLTDSQCAALSDHLSQAIGPLDPAGEADWRLGCLRRIQQLPEAQLRGFFSEWQWTAIQAQWVRFGLVVRELETEAAEMAKNPVRVVIENNDGTVSRFR